MTSRVELLDVFVGHLRRKLEAGNERRLIRRSAASASSERTMSFGFG